MVEDIVDLVDVHAAGLVQLLEKRFRKHKPYLMCRDLCIALNPFRPLNLHDNAMRLRYGRGCERTPAHVYRVAEAAWCGLKRGGLQTIVITGESGSGKTENARLCLEYIAFKMNSGNGTSESLCIERILHTNSVLEYMGNAQTVRNHNSSRFGRLLTLAYDSHDQLAGAQLQTYLFERTRVAHGNEGEGSFRLFYAILEEDSLREQYGLHAVDPSVFGNETAAVVTTWAFFEDAARSVGFTDAELSGLIDIAVGVMQLLMRDYGSAATALGLEHADMAHRLEHRRIQTQSEQIWTTVEPEETRTRLKAVAMTLYEQKFHDIVERLNATLWEPSFDEGTPLGILDLCGFERYRVNHFEQLCTNYCNERMHAIFVNQVIVKRRQSYEEEGFELGGLSPYPPRMRAIDVCEKTIFPTIHEAQRLRQSPDKLLHAFSSRQTATLVVPDVTQPIFVVKHYAGPVEYSTETMVVQNDTEMRSELADMLRASSESGISELFGGASGALTPKDMPSMRSNMLSILQEKMKDLAESLEKGGTHYVCCIRPNEHASSDSFDAQYVETQVLSTALTHAHQVMRLGYPLEKPMFQFVSQFPLCTLRRNRPVVSSAGGFWGRTVVYMSESSFRAVCKTEAQLVIARALRRRARRRETRDWAARTVQRVFRMHIQQPGETYRELSEMERLRSQVRTLKNLVERRDAWIFRATTLLKKYALSDGRITEFAKTYPQEVMGEVDTDLNRLLNDHAQDA